VAIIQIPIASRGLTAEHDPSRIVTGDLVDAQNIDYTAGNLLQKDGGSTKFNSTVISGTPVVFEGNDWWPDTSTQKQILATGDGKLLKFDMTGALEATLKSGLGSNKVTQFIAGGKETSGNNRKLFSVNGNDVIQVLSGNGVTTSNISSPPVEWTGTNQPTFGFLFRNCFVAGGNLNAPHRLYGSDAGDHENLTTGGSFSLNIYPGDGQRLVAGLASITRAFLWKYPFGVYYIDDSTTTPTGWFAKPITHEFGSAPTPHSVIAIDNGILAFMSNTGDIILMQEGDGTLSGIQFVNLMKALNLRTFIQQNFNLARLDRTQLEWYEDKKQLHVIYAAIATTVENRRLVFDFNSERTRVSVVNKDVNESLWMVLDSTNIPRPFAGDNVGFVRKLDQTNRLVDGAAYTLIAQTVPHDFSDVQPEFMVKKLFYRLHMEYEATGNYDVGCEVTIDSRSIGTVYFNQSGTGAILSFTLPAVLGGNEIRRRSRDIGGEGYYLSLRLFESGPNNPKIARMWAEFDPLVPAR